STPHVQSQKKPLETTAHITKQSCRRPPKLQSQARDLAQELTKVMRGFGRRCRWQGRVFVTLVRQTEHQLLKVGEPIKAFGLKTIEGLGHTLTLSAGHRERLTLPLTTSVSHHNCIQTRSTRLAHGK